jgi:hypothetical protein
VAWWPVNTPFRIQWSADQRVPVGACNAAMYVAVCYPIMAILAVKGDGMSFLQRRLTGLRRGLVCALALSAPAQPQTPPVAAYHTEAQDTAGSGTYRLTVRSTQTTEPAGDKPFVVMLVLQADPLNVSGLDRTTRGALAMWYMYIDRLEGSANACFTTSDGEGSPPNRANLAHWSSSQDKSTVHVTLDRSPDDAHKLTLDVHSADVRGQIVHDAANPGEFTGVEETVEGTRIGPPDPTLCFTAAKPLAAAIIPKGGAVLDRTSPRP